MDIDFSAVKQVVFNAVAGGLLTLGIGSLGTHLVRFMKGESFHGIDSKHPVASCIKVVIVALPLWYLYKCYGERHTLPAIRPSAYEIIFLITSAAILKYTETKITPLLSLVLVLTHLSWKIFATTEKGGKMLGVIV
jgi:hypothetical protein